MKSILISILIIFSLGSLINAQNGQYPPSGVYIGLNGDFLYNLGEQFTSELVNNLTNYNFPTISGSSGSVSYTFSSFKVDLALNGFYYIQTSTTGYELGWTEVQFILQWNYHICDKQIINVCEDGYIQVFTNGTSTIIVDTDVVLDFQTTSTTLTATDTSFDFNNGDVLINVQCTNTICAIPTSDIAQEVANNFVTEATTGITNAMNSKAASFVPLLNPIKQLPFSIHGETYWVNYEGQIVESSNSNSYTPTMSLAVNGGIIVETENGNYIYPSQSPSFVPSNYQLENFTTDYLITFTPFFFESFADAAFDSELPFFITSEMVPPDSPVTLNTSDPFFNESAPGMTAKYPDQAIAINLHDPVSPIVSIIPGGSIVLNNTQVSADFIITYDGVEIDLFTILFTIDMQVDLIMNVENNAIAVNGSITSFTPNATLSSSTVGDVEMMGFVQILQLLESQIKFPSLSYPIPATYTIDTFEYSSQDQIFQIAIDLSKNSNVFSPFEQKQIFDFDGVPLIINKKSPKAY